MRTTSKMGLASWDQLDDNYSYGQLAGNWQILDFHDHSPGRGVPISAGGIGVGAVLSQSIAAGQINGQHLNTQLTEDLGLNAGTNIGRGQFNYPTAETVGTPSPSALSHPDVVSGIMLQSNGLILVDYQALWRNSGTGGGTITATLMLNGSPLLVATNNGAPAAASVSTTATHLSYLASNGGGLITGNSTLTDSSESPTGQAINGGAVRIYAPAGTYTVGVYFSASGGGIASVQNRHLWVYARNYI